MVKEKVRTKRAYVHFPVTLGGMISATALDLSLDGIFIASDEPLSRGDELIVNIDLDEFHLELEAQVLYVISGWGFGARFVGRSLDHAIVLTRIMGIYQIGVESDGEGERERYKPAVLIIDENEHYWKLKLQAMERIFHVVKVNDGEKGLNALKQGPVDLVISELRNRKVDAFRILQFMEINPKIQAPMIVLTGLYNPADRTLLKKRGAVAFFDKLKTSQEKLIGKINEILLT
ncbi:MAG TPA: PilZ domain-containing protein [Dissulfurispiraceae bacterium]|nr:PilZ domain-containing protein [Dissulfurispiraceae bacterium]